jgi:D-alanine-D-alanine ligase
MNLTNQRIGVLCGGRSQEREVSLKSGEAVYTALREEGLNVVKVDAQEDIVERLKKEKITMVFLALHGGWGEDGTIQGICKLLGIPFTGPDILGSALALDKIAAKKMLISEGLSTPSFVDISSYDSRKENIPELVERIKKRLSFPLILKPAREGSSIGLKVIQKVDHLGSAIKELTGYGKHILIEEYLEAKEITVGVMGLEGSMEPLPVIEVRPKSGIYNFKAKYTPGVTEYLVPAPLSKFLYQQAQEFALRSCKALNLEIVSRIDMLVDAQEKIYVIEANTNPGMTQTSLLPKAAQVAGYSFSQLLIKILELALKREKKRRI